MASTNQLIRMAESFEDKAKALRLAASILGDKAQAFATRALPSKLRKAARLRQDAEPPRVSKPQNPEHRGLLLRLVAQVFETRKRITEENLLVEAKAAGFQGRGLGSLHRAKLVARRPHGWIVLTNKGRRRLAELESGGPYRQPSRAKAKARTPKKSTNGTNGKGHGSETQYVAELVKANNGPMSGTDILAKAKADGRRLKPQAIGAAKRYGLIVSTSPENGERMFNAPA